MNYIVFQIIINIIYNNLKWFLYYAYEIICIFEKNIIYQIIFCKNKKAKIYQMSYKNIMKNEQILLERKREKEKVEY